jgi:hypothetical protein
VQFAIAAIGATTRDAMTELLFLQWRHLSGGERIGLGVLAATLVAWLFVPALAQDPGYHAFADTRAWLGVPHAADVLSNLAFLAVGAFGAAALASPRRDRMSRATEAGLWCVAAGFVATAIGSAWYHLNPNDATLAWDRLAMTVIFTGVLGTAIAQRIGDNVARVALAVIFELGVASVVYWRLTADLSLYVTLQYGGFVALLLLVALARRRDDPFAWGALLAWYAVAKLAELADQAIWDASGGIFAGHALKHVAAAIGGYTLFRALGARRPAALAATAAPRA